MKTSTITIKQLENTLKSHPGPGSDHNASGRSAPAAVSVLFNVTNGEPCVLMIKRAERLSHHSGEWAFPGGMIEESDESAMHAALRETNEELGVDASDIDIWCEMSPIDTSTGFEVWPFAGRIGDNVQTTPQEAEVAEVVYVPVRVFVDQKSRRSITIIRGGITRKFDAFAYEHRIIWGASARIIANTIDIVMNAA